MKKMDVDLPDTHLFVRCWVNAHTYPFCLQTGPN